MILECGDPSTIKFPDWYVMELRADQQPQVEETLRRIMLEMPRIFQGAGAEVFVPVQRTRHCSFSLKTKVYVFVRADDVNLIGRLRRITGVVGINAKNGSSRPSAFIPVDHEWVDQLALEVKNEYFARGQAIHMGGWVRILDGQQRDYFGTVVSLANGRACVQVDMQTKQFFVDTSIYNLLDCSDIDPAYRVFFYSEPVERMIEDNPERAAELLKPYLTYDEEAARAWLSGGDAEVPAPVVPASDRVCVSRERTPTRFVRSLIQSGERDVQKILTKTVAAIRAGDIRRPGTVTILWHIIRAEMVAWAFPKEHLKTYTELVAKHGDKYQLLPKDVVHAFPELEFVKEVVEVITPRKAPRPPRVKKISAEVVEIPVSASQTPKVRATVSSLIREYLSNGGRDLIAAVTIIEAALQKGRVRAPKHLNSLVHAVKAQVFREFRNTHPGATYVEIIEAEGESLRIGVSCLRERLPNLEAIILKTRITQTKQIEATTTETPMVVTRGVRPRPAITATVTDTILPNPKGRKP